MAIEEVLEHVAERDFPDEAIIGVKHVQNLLFEIRSARLCVVVGGAVSNVIPTQINRFLGNEAVETTLIACLSQLVLQVLENEAVALQNIEAVFDQLKQGVHGGLELIHAVVSDEEVGLKVPVDQITNGLEELVIEGVVTNVVGFFEFENHVFRRHCEQAIGVIPQDAARSFFGDKSVIKDLLQVVHHGVVILDPLGILALVEFLDVLYKNGFAFETESVVFPPGVAEGGLYLGRVRGGQGVERAFFFGETSGAYCVDEYQSLAH